MDLQKTAECPVCMELFTEPKVLACGHCFCKKCIKPTPCGFGVLPKVTCPECRHDSSVPAGGFPTVYRLQDIVSNLESAGFRNTKDCNGCGRRTPKAELFSCTTCKEEVGDEQEIVICSLCFMNAHKAHDYVRYNKATQRDVDEARNKVGGDGIASQVRVDMVRTELHEMTQDVMQALDARAPKHDEISNELEGALRADASKDDVEAKVNHSSEHAAETAKISLEMRNIIHACGRQLKECIEKKGEPSPAAAVKSTDDQPSTSAAAAASPQRLPTVRLPMNAYNVFRWSQEIGEPAGAAERNASPPSRSESRSRSRSASRSRSPSRSRSRSRSRPRSRSPSRSTWYSPSTHSSGYSPVSPTYSSPSPSAMRSPRHTRASPSYSPRSPSYSSSPSPRYSPQSRSSSCSPRRSTPPRSPASSALALRYPSPVLRPSTPTHTARSIPSQTASQLFSAAFGAPSTSGTTAGRNTLQQPARGRSPRRDTRRQTRPGTSAMPVSSREEHSHNRFDDAARAPRSRKRARRDSGD